MIDVVLGILVHAHTHEPGFAQFLLFAVFFFSSDSTDSDPYSIVTPISTGTFYFFDSE